MQKMSNLDYHSVAEELQRLVGGYLNKAYEPRPGVLRLKFHKDGEVNLAVELGVRIHLTKYIEEPSGEPSSFTKFLRTELENSKVTAIRQLNFDRIIAIDFEKTGERYSVVFEMFQKGNAIVCGHDGKILKVYRPEIYSARKLRHGEHYTPPPNTKKHPQDITAADFAGVKGKAVPVVSKVVNLPPSYLEEACARSGIPLDKKFEALSDKEIASLIKIVRTIASSALEPCVYWRGGKAVAFSPFLLTKFAGAGLELRRYASFSEALDEYYANAEPEPEKDVVLEKLEAVLEQQKSAVTRLENEAADAKAAGDEIYRNSALYDEILAEADLLLKQKKTVNEIAVLLERKFGRKARIAGRKLVVA